MTNKLHAAIKNIDLTKIKDRLNFSDFFFFIVFGFFFIFRFIQLSKFNIPIQYLDKISFSLYALTTLLVCIKIKTILKLSKLQILIYLIGTICCIFLFPDNMLLVPWLILISATGMKFKSIVKFVLVLLSFLIPITIGAVLFGFIDNDLFYRYNELILTRYSMGFKNPNFAAIYIFQFISCLLILRWNKIGWKENISILIAFCIVYCFCNTRTISMSLILLFLLINAYKHKEIAFPRLKKLAYISCVCCPLISFLFAFLYNKGYIVTDYINIMLQHRIRNLSYCLNYYELLPFGTQVTRLNDFHVIDNCYGAILIKYGYLTLILFFLSYFYLLKRIIRERNPILLIILTVFLYIGVMENYLWLLHLNVTLFAFTTITKEDSFQESFS